MDKAQQNALEAWDPLASESDPGMIIAAQRREIRNILKSYTGYYDVFSELMQNSLDAVERRIEDGDATYTPEIWISIDVAKSFIAVTDNGCGMEEIQFKQFLRPNFSFKSGSSSRGSKGVGATYLGYGFNHLEVATKKDGKLWSGVLRRGREWVEDRTESIPRPKVEPVEATHEPFTSLDRGTSMVVRLVGKAIRPRDLSWIGADNANKWLAVLRTNTPLGGVYLCNTKPKVITIHVDVVDAQGHLTQAELNEPRYLFPSEVMQRVADLREYLADQKRRVERGLDVSKIPPKFRSLNGLWGEWGSKRS